MSIVTDQQDEREGCTRAGATLAPELRRSFEKLVDDYAVSAKIHEGEVAIEYDVLADLVRAGWR